LTRVRDRGSGGVGEGQIFKAGSAIIGELEAKCEKAQDEWWQERKRKRGFEGSGYADLIIAATDKQKVSLHQRKVKRMSEEEYSSDLNLNCVPMNPFKRVPISCTVL
jgi:hypothetical protein